MMQPLVMELRVPEERRNKLCKFHAHVMFKRAYQRSSLKPRRHVESISVATIGIFVNSR
jgi:hypothetical protein